MPSPEPDFWVSIDPYLPALAILVPTVLAIVLAVLQQRLSRRSREQERADRVIEDVLESLVFFISGDPHTEDMRPPIRQLRARVMLLQGLPGRRHRLLGDWLGAEVQRAVGLLVDAMEIAGPQSDPLEVMRVFAKPRSVIDGIVKILVAWMRGVVTDRHLRDRMKELAAESAAGPDS